MKLAMATLQEASLVQDQRGGDFALIKTLLRNFESLSYLKSEPALQGQNPSSRTCLFLEHWLTFFWVRSCSNFLTSSYCECKSLVLRWFCISVTHPIPTFFCTWHALFQRTSANWALPATEFVEIDGPLSSVCLIRLGWGVDFLRAFCRNLQSMQRTFGLWGNWSERGRFGRRGGSWDLHAIHVKGMWASSLLFSSFLLTACGDI